MQSEYCWTCCHPMEEWELNICEGCGMKPNIGGKREGAGRPAPLGRKKPVGIRLTPEVVEFCKQHPQGFVVLEEKLRKSKEFRDWLAMAKGIEIGKQMADGKSV